MTIAPYPNYDQIEAAISEHGPKIWHSLQAKNPGIFDGKYWQGALIDWVIKNPEFKTDLFRFVDVLPSLQTNRQIVDYAKSYILGDGRRFPKLLNLSFKLLQNNITAGLAADSLKKNISQMAENFIAASSISKTTKPLRKLHDEGYGFTADILGEKTTSDEEADAYLARYFSLIDHLSAEVTGWQKPIVATGNMPPVANISLKISALDSQIDPVDLYGSVARLKTRVLPLLLHAKKNNVFINFDMEQWEYHFITNHLFEEVATSPELRNWPHLGIVIQAYLRHAEQDFDFHNSLAKGRGTPITVRLVKGAYWDYEVIHAAQLGLRPPVWLRKKETDANYEKLSYRLLKDHETLRPAFASHNIRSLLCVEEQAKLLKLSADAMEIQMLIGMAEPIRDTFKARGQFVRLYTPIGEMLPGMSYLVRRLLENTSNSGFLRQGFYDAADVTHLLKSPHEEGERNNELDSSETDAELLPFQNAPFLEFCLPDISQQFQKAVDEMEVNLPQTVPLVIGGKELKSATTLDCFSPNDQTLLVSTTSQGTIREADQAVHEALQAWPVWRETDLAERAAKIHELGDLIQESRVRLAALQTIESGKPWREADGDVAEAIDFCHYYATQALSELACRPTQSMAGEENTLYYEGRGPTVIIGPWNFPLAILCGMTTAALVAGNSVIIKPSSNANATAYEFYRLLKKLDLPAGVSNFLPGSGALVGEHLVTHPDVAQIAFTGSKEIGLQIIAKAAITKENQREVKKVICEMGGKNAIIIDDDADMDLAISSVVQSAFGYAGQKCSACSRVIVLKTIYQQFSKRLIAAIASLTIASASRPECRLGPVIDKVAQQRLNKIIAKIGSEGSILYQGKLPPLPGNFVPPLLLEVSNSKTTIFQRELFGPILALIQAKDFDNALSIAGDSEFTLTGAIFSRHKGHIRQATRKFRVGNLYINKGSTGAAVSRQPFGGFGMSGLGNKAGGPGYLTLFTNSRCISENTMRQGFSPDIQL